MINKNKKKNTKLISKKLLSLISCSFAAIFTIVPIISVSNDSVINTKYSYSTINNDDISFDENANLIEFNGKVYDSYSKAASDYLSDSNNYYQKVYIGNKKTSNSVNNIYNVVDTSEMYEYDSTRISNAYKTFSNNYVEDIDEAKKTYLDQPVIRYIDSYGNEYDSYDVAHEAMLKNRRLISPVAYYELKDYSELDNDGNPKIVKINPLNKEDIDYLKKMAILGINQKNSGFSLNRYVYNDPINNWDKNNNYYYEKEFNGKTAHEVDLLVDKVINDIYSILVDSVWVNPYVTITTDVPFLDLGPSNATRRYIKYIDELKRNNSQKGLSFSKMLTDSKTLIDKDLLKQNLDLYGWQNPSKNITYYDLKTKPNSKWFGGQEYDWKLYNGRYLSNMYHLYLGSNDISFIGMGKKSNGWFNIEINQDQYYNLAHNMNNPTFYQERINSVSAAVEKTKEYLWKMKWEYLPSMTDGMFSNFIDKVAKSVLSFWDEPILEKGKKISVNNFKDFSQLDHMKDELIKNFRNVWKNKFLKSYGYEFEFFDNWIRSSFEKEYRTNENYDGSNSEYIIYVINYNNSPLFYLKNNVFKDIYKNDDFIANPSNALKSYINNKLIDDYSSINEFKKNLFNVSNLFVKKFDNRAINSNQINYLAIKNDKYNNDISGYYNVQFHSLNGNDEYNLDTGINKNQLFINPILQDDYKINESELNKQLNLFDNDDPTYLNNRWGTYHAIYQYNKQLDFLLKDKELFDQLRNGNSKLGQSFEKNRVTNFDDIISLYELDRSPMRIKYGEYFRYGHRFNESLSSNEIEILSSRESKYRRIRENGWANPSITVAIQDRDGNVLAKENVRENTQDAIDDAKELAISNAVNKVEINGINDSVFYETDDGKKEIVKNQKHNLHVLDLSTNGSKKYAFENYQNAHSFMFDYIKLNSNGEGNDKKVWFNNEISQEDITSIVSKFPSVDFINKLDSKNKFKFFHELLNIKSFATWDRKIRDIILSEEISPYDSESKYVSINITLKDGYYFNDTGSNMHSVYSEFVPNLGFNEDEIISTNSQSSSKVSAIGISVGFVILLIIVSTILTILLVNKRKK